MLTVRLRLADESPGSVSFEVSRAKVNVYGKDLFAECYSDEAHCAAAVALSLAISAATRSRCICIAVFPS